MSNDLTKVNFKTIYFNQNDVEEFYSKALNNAKLYKRITAYFSIGIFKYLKKGMAEFVNNDGYMELLLSEDIDQSTINQINRGYDQKTLLKDTSKKIIIERINELCNQDDINLFSYLIAVGKLDVKLVYKLKGIVHDKFGVISDGIHNLVYIGSNNFTEAATTKNDEAFQVTIDWDNPSKRELSSINELNQLFDSIWNNKKEDVITIEMPDPVITELISKINYNEIKKYRKNFNFIRFDLDDKKEVILTSNIDMSTYFNYKNLGEYSSKNFLFKKDKCYILRKIQRITEINDFKNKIRKICLDNNISFFMTKRSSEYFELHYKNYDILASKGIRIKSNDYFNTEEFLNYKKSINSYIKRPLKDSQLRSAIHLIELERSLNFSVPGSGKTATVLGAFEYLANSSALAMNHVDKLLVIGPINCAKSWKDEYIEVSNEADKHSPLCLINNDNTILKSDVLLHDFYSSRIIILNYELVPKLKTELCELIDSKTMVVFDEIHRIKKIDSAKYQCLKEVIHNTRYRIALTGTPLPNGYIDLYNMMSLLHEDFTQTYFQMFESALKNDDSRYRKTGLQNSSLNEILYPFFIRVDKNDLKVPLPEPDHLIEVQTNDYERELYRKIDSAKMNSFERTIKMVEIGCVPFKCEQTPDKICELTRNDGKSMLTSKLCKFLSILKSNNRKAIVWCNFVDTINTVTNLLEDNGYYVKSIYGNTEQTDREKIIDEFNYGTLQILVTNPATLAESVSLHKACHDAHYLELNYNLYQYLQSRDRIHRLGLKDTDKTNYYIYLNYYDENLKLSKDFDIYNALKKKEELMNKSIGKGNFVFGMNDEMEFE